MTNKAKEYEESDFEEPANNSQKSPTKKKRIEAGLSITKLGRLSLTTGLQIEMGIDPTDRDQLTFVEVRAHKSKDGDDKYTFFIRFYDNHEGMNGPGHTVYKPNRKEKSGITNNTSYVEFARYLKKKELITSVGTAKDELNSGPVDILERNKEKRTLIINLKSRFKRESS